MTSKSAIISALALSIGMSACSGQESFAQRDPKGYEACSAYAAAQKETDPIVKLNSNFAIGDLAREAGTKEIQDSVEAMFDEDAMEALRGTESEGRNFFMIDNGKFVAACKASGFDL